MENVSVHISTKTRIVLLIFSLITVTALHFDLTTPITEWHNNGMEINGQNIISVIMLIFIYKLYLFSYIKLPVHVKPYRNTLCCIIPSALFSLFMIWGYSFAKQSNWFLVMDGLEQFCKSLFRFAGYFLLFFALIRCIFAMTDKITVFQKNNTGHNRMRIPSTNIFSCMEKRPFVTSLIILFITYIPYIILSFPGILTTDSRYQILQTYTEEVALSNNHPITHTFLMYLCLKTGEALFHSHNIGLFIFVFLQFFCFIAVISYFIKTIINRGVSTKLCCCILLYYILSPWCQNYMFLVTKDVYYSIFLILFCLWMFQITDSNITGKKTVLFTLISFGVILFRNDGRYVVFLTLLLSWFIIKKARKALRITALCTILLCAMLSLLLPYFQVAPGSAREMLSIPFQQTARYIRDAGDDVTADEKAAISAVLDYERIGQIYVPELSDRVKNTYHASSKKDLILYMKAWWKMFLKHPGIYIQATMNNTYSYFYPEYYNYAIAHQSTIYYYPYRFGSLSMNILNEKINTDFHYIPGLDRLRTFYEKTRATFASLPVFTLFVTPAFYTWLIILWGFYCLRQKKLKSFISVLPLVFVLMVCVASPANATYSRYIYSIAMSLPVGLVLGLNIIRQK